MAVLGKRRVGIDHRVEERRIEVLGPCRIILDKAGVENGDLGLQVGDLPLDLGALLLGHALAVPLGDALPHVGTLGLDVLLIVGHLLGWRGEREPRQRDAILDLLDLGVGLKPGLDHQLDAVTVRHHVGGGVADVGIGGKKGVGRLGIHRLHLREGVDDVVDGIHRTNREADLDGDLRLAQLVRPLLVLLVGKNDLAADSVGSDNSVVHGILPFTYIRALTLDTIIALIIALAKSWRVAQLFAHVSHSLATFLDEQGQLTFLLISAIL